MPSHNIPCQSCCIHAFVCIGADTRESGVLVGRDATVASCDITYKLTNELCPHSLLLSARVVATGIRFHGPNRIIWILFLVNPYLQIPE
jgi:hypothetical protein